MTAHYGREIEQLGAVYRFAVSANVDPLSRFLESIAELPLSAVGSGGSYSTACFAACHHEHFSGQMARYVTPLEVLDHPHTRSGAMCFSASGRNRDIGAAFRTLCKSEPGPVGALVMASDSPLHDIQRKFATTRVVSFSDTVLKDGFLAVATMIASAIVLARAYEDVFRGEQTIPNDLDQLAGEALDEPNFRSVISNIEPALQRDTVSLIHTPSAKPVAVDLESRFVEAALGNIHIADLRNFGHGRHHWLAKRSDTTGVVALVGADWSKLKNRTLDLLPAQIPIFQLELHGSYSVQAVAGLLVGLHISMVAGSRAGIDPGKPGVPDFGRRLYRLGPGASKIKQSDANRQAAILRKAPVASLSDPAKLKIWDSAYEAAIKQLQSKPIGAVVFDYDGTLCEIDRRFEPLRDDVSLALRSLIERGMIIGVATGRGPSAGKALRDALPAAMWHSVMMGYYNGAVVTSLSDDRDPLVESEAEDPFHSELVREAMFEGSTIRANSVQISIRLDEALSPNLALAKVHQLIDSSGLSFRLLSSGHSIDVFRVNQSKAKVVDAVRTALPDEGLEIVRIGDQGCWPGNDAELLDDSFGVSVDIASSHLSHCWNLAPAGLKGVHATLFYLKCMDHLSGGTRFKIRNGDRGVSSAS